MLRVELTERVLDPRGPAGIARRPMGRAQPDGCSGPSAAVVSTREEGTIVTWIWIVLAVVVIGGLVGLWVANAARLARINGQLHRRSPTMRERAGSIERGEEHR